MPNNFKANLTHKKFKIESPTIIYYVISMDNVHQTGDEFKAFIDLLERNSKMIEKLVLISSAWLYKVYVGPKEAEQKASEWLTNNEETLQNSIIGYEYYTWETYFNSDGNFTNKVEQLRELYQQDEGYRIRVDNLANQFKNKGSFEAAKEYVINDSAAAFYLKNCVLAYPFKELNPAIDYVANKFELDIKYMGYRVDKIKEVSSTNTNDTYKSNEIRLAKTCLKVIKLLEEQGIQTKCAQTFFFSKIIDLCELSRQKNTDEIGEDTKNAKQTLRPS